MAIYFCMLVLIWMCGVTILPTKNSIRKKRYFIITTLIMILIAALRSPSVGTDLGAHYAKRFVDIASYAWGEIPHFASFTGYGIGYCYFTKLLTIISNNVQFYIVIVSVITYGTMGWFLYKNSANLKDSVLLFILSGTFYNYMNIVRQALAISIVLIAYEVLKKRTTKSTIVFTMLILLAASFHTSAIVCFLFIVLINWKFERKEVLLSIVCTFAFYILYNRVFSWAASLVSGVSNYSRYAAEGNVEGVGYINMQSIYMLVTVWAIFAVGVVFIVFNKRRFVMNQSDTDNIEIAINSHFLLFMGLFASVCRLMVFRMNILNRLTWYFIPFIFLLYPATMRNISNARNRKVLKILIYMLMLGYFLMMTVKYEAVFHKTVPYYFYWE